MTSNVEYSGANLQAFLDSSPTPHHVVSNVIKELEPTYKRFVFGDADLPNFGYLAVEGTIIAWRIPEDRRVDRFRIVGAHTDSPTLRVRPNPDLNSSGFGKIAVEIYGSALLNSWLDRDLGIAGVVVIDDSEPILVCSSAPVARIPQLAIHLDRDVNERGLVLDRDLHLSALWCTDDKNKGLRHWISEQIGCESGDIKSWNLSFFDFQDSAVIGADSCMLTSGRIDNQLSCWAATNALLNANQHNESVNVLALFDHEEVGSTSITGAGGPLLQQVLDVICSRLGLSSESKYAAYSKSLFISSDNAHGVHPNYPERHDLYNAPIVNHGIAIKTNENQRYSSSYKTVAEMIHLFQAVNLPHQNFVSRNGTPCGSTIGPVVSATLGIPTVDIGVPQLSMHSAREVCGTRDAMDLPKLLQAHFEA